MSRCLGARSTNRATKLREPQRTGKASNRLSKRDRRERATTPRYRTQEVAGSSPASSIIRNACMWPDPPVSPSRVAESRDTALLPIVHLSQCETADRKTTNLSSLPRLLTQSDVVGESPQSATWLANCVDSVVRFSTEGADIVLTRRSSLTATHVRRLTTRL
jgi:hypothetical protein